MSNALPALTNEIRLTEIPGELRRLNEANAELRAALRRSTDLYVQTLGERDEARATIERARISALPVDRKAEEIRVLRALVRDIWEEIEASRTPSIETVADLLRDFVAEHGAECDACEGSGLVTDIEPVSFGGPNNAYYERETVGECAYCRSGRVPR